MNLAIVHEYFCNLGGSETVVRALHELYPDAPVFTLQIYDRNRGHEWLRGMDLRTSFIQRLPLAGRTHQVFLPLMPYAIESFDLTKYDIILSSSSFIAKGIIPPPNARHFSYTQTRQRVAWDLESEYVNAVPRPLRLIARAYMHNLRIWDVTAAQRVDRFVANSHFVARRIKQLYGREALVIPPPVDTDLFKPMDVTRGEYYVAVGRLVKYKRFDLAIAACKALGRPLKIVGDGPERRTLEKMAAGGPIEFLGAQSHTKIRDVLAGARALLFPGLEDFGIVPVEAQAMGCLVIAYGEGGVLDTVRDGETGVLFGAQTMDALVEAIRRADDLRPDPGVLRENALGFSAHNFKTRISRLISGQPL
ncbi:MAG: glycosyltransferase [Anaerolineae bacterium]|nr:glycosyltransferase [Anaerolineae bacterium]